MEVKKAYTNQDLQVHPPRKNKYSENETRATTPANQNNTSIDLPEPPPHIYRGDVAIYEEEDMDDVVEILELIIDSAPTAIPELSDLSPLEAFKYQISQFGWNVILKGCEFSQKLLEKVKYYSNMLLSSGEWNPEPMPF